MRSGRLKSTLLGLIMLGTLAIAALLSAPPNVVVVLADDQSYRDFGFMGNELVHTPNLDRLAQRSAVYPHGYVPMSVCRPSLATLLTGLYPHQHGVHFNHPPPGLSKMKRMTAAEYRAARQAAKHLVGDRPTLPRRLGAMGYATFQAGKHWEGDFSNAGFTHGMTTGLPAESGDWILGTRQQTNGQLVAHGNGDLGLAIGRQTMQPIADFIDEQAGQRPFLVWYAPFLPHTPFDAGPEFHEPYANKLIPAHLEPYYAEIARFDATVGQLVDIVKSQGLLNETIFIFASDNGFQPDPADHGRADDRSKLSVDEDGLRTPILIAWPKHTVAARHDAIVQTIDLMPTVLNAVGDSARAVDSGPGISLWPSATGQAVLPERPAFGAIYPNDASVLNQPERHVRARWARSGDWKLVLAGPNANAIPSALYHLADDPDEEHNRFDDPSAIEKQTKLTALLNNWWPLPQQEISK